MRSPPSLRGRRRRSLSRKAQIRSDQIRSLKIETRRLCLDQGEGKRSGSGKGRVSTIAKGEESVRHSQKPTFTEVLQNPNPVVPSQSQVQTSQEQQDSHSCTREVHLCPRCTS